MKTRLLRTLLLLVLGCLAPVATQLAAAEAPASPVTVYAEVVALDQPFMFNRLGAAQPQGMIFALKRDVISNVAGDKTLKAGNVMLRPDKRARPLVLRVNVGDYLEIAFTNLLSPVPTNPTNGSLQPATRAAGVHIAGLELISVTNGGIVQPGINSDATWVGTNTNAVAPSGGFRTYKYYARAEGTYMLYSAGADWNGQLQAGLFGAVTVEPPSAEWYRSQVTQADLALAARGVVPDTAPGRMIAPSRPDISITKKISAEGVVLTATTDGVKEELWAFAEVETERQTVHKTDVVVRDGHLYTPDGRPIVDYDAVYQAPDLRAGQPILKMTRPRGTGSVELIYSDLTALITGPGGGNFPFTINGPDFYANPTYPNRREPFREFTIMYHESFGTVQAFQQFFTPSLFNMISAGTDNFAINYGSAGIGAEVLASRMGVGPMGGKQSVDLKFEEFFLSSWACGDPAMVVDVPANTPNNTVTAPNTLANPTVGSKQINSPIVTASANLPVPQSANPFVPLDSAKATKAFFPDDPSNVYHSYMRDHVTMRLLHTGGGITHVHHLHAHQWLRSPNSDDSHYLDSQMITPGSTFTLEIAHNGSGNRNETVGDSIFHCHFYPHFAGGMWALWRVHDVFEAGTKLDAKGIPVPGWNRALPDGEITAGTPIPGLVPMPTLAMAPAPAPVRLIENGTRVEVAAKPGADPASPTAYDNPGYPYFVPGVSGHRAPHPPLDFAWEEEVVGKPKLDAAGRKTYLDGGLPRHQVLDGTIVHELHTRWDFSKDFLVRDKSGKPVAGGLIAFELPEDGTAVEKAAMAAHSTRTRASFLPNGDPGNFTLNGLPPVPGAPFANPSVDENGNSEINTRRYQGAAVQMDVVFNKQGWHFPQQRLLTLWQDVKPTVKGERPPQPLFFRANTGETVEFWHTNLVPDYYDLDDFQVRTPTDIIGQHIHLVKFDVLASDGAGNGWNYEDGTFSPDEVRTRIDAINLSKGLFSFDPKTQFKGTTQRTLAIKPAPAVFGEPPAGQDWAGAQTTIQRWDTDAVENNKGEDRTLRTVFTHDHFGPSTHQQVGLYGGLLVEPQGSKWYDPVSGGLLYDTKIRRDGGPTSWQANIVTANHAESYREFALEFGDFQLAYTAGSPSKAGPATKPQFTATFTGLQAGPASAAVAAVFATNQAPLTTASLAAASAGWLVTSSNPGVGGQNSSTVSYTLTSGTPSGTYVVTTVPTLFSAAFPTLQAGPVPATVSAIFTQNGIVLTNGQLVASGSSWLLNANVNGAPASYLLSPTTPTGTYTVSTVLFSAPFPGLQAGPASAATSETFAENGLFIGAQVAASGTNWVLTNPIPAGGGSSQVYNLIAAAPAGSFQVFPVSPLFTTAFGSLQAGAVTPATSTIFSNNGVTLTSAQLTAAGSNWTLTNHPAAGVTEVYTLVSTLPVKGSSYQVFPQDIPANWASPNFAINTPAVDTANSRSGAPYPTLISVVAPPGTFALNYRNEPVPSRLADATGKLASGQAGDLSWAYSSTVTRANPALNIQPVPGTAISAGSTFKFPPDLVPTVNGTAAPTPADVGKVQPGDPYTPTLRAYAGDRIQVRTLVGAHHNPHFFSMEGVKWLHQPDSANTGYLNNQPMGISEHYEMLFDLPRATAATPKPFADYLYNASAGVDGITNGAWGLMRSYKQKVDQLVPLPNNAPADKPVVAALQPPLGAKVRKFHVVATTAQQALGTAGVVYNSRGQAISPSSGSKPTFNSTQITQPTGLLYVRAEDLTSPDAKGKLKPGVPVEPLILRAAAGEWIEVTLTNAFDVTQAAFTTPLEASAPYGAGVPAIAMKTSTLVGLNPQVVGYDITTANGLNVGFNPTETVAPGKSSPPIHWYGGTVTLENGVWKTTPVELGSINLNPSDPLQQHTLGLVGALVIEPVGSTWKEDATMRAAATVTKADGSTFRDFVMVCQDDVPLLPNISTPGGPAPITSQAVNYRTEPFSYRFPNGTSGNVVNATANSLTGGDPQTPIFTAPAGTAVRFRMVHPASGAGADGETFTLDGHVFQEEPFTDGSHVIGNNELSQWFGTRGGHGARNRFEVVIESAGGEHRVPGDYLYRSLVTLLGGGDFAAGYWGIFRVTGPTPVTTNALLAETAAAPGTPDTKSAPHDTPIIQRYKDRAKPVSERHLATPPSPQ